ncbi:MAG: hypothetical protein AB1589_22820 [Cyanobacteriota bacterium]
MKYTSVAAIAYTSVIVSLVNLASPVVSEPTHRGSCRDHRVENCLVVDGYVPPNHGGPDSSRNGTGTRAVDCKHRGHDRRDCQKQVNFYAVYSAPAAKDCKHRGHDRRDCQNPAQAQVV